MKIRTKTHFIFLLKSLVVIIAVIVFSNYLHYRFDLTEDSRYTLSDTTLGALDEIDEVLYINVILDGELPPKYKKLQIETKQILEELFNKNSLIKYSIVNPLDDDDKTEATIKYLLNLGLEPMPITVKEGPSVSQHLIFPWALINYKERTIRVPLIKKGLGLTNEEKINASIQQLEYSFTTAILKVLKGEKKKIAILKGNGELDDVYIADFLKGLKESYAIAPFTLDSVEQSPQKTLDSLSQFDLAIISKPSEPFTDKEKQILDQYIMKGGRLLALIDEAKADMDSLVHNKSYFAYPQKLNIEDLFFKYGARINPVLIKDLSYTNLVFASGKGSKTDYQTVPWLYAPQVTSPQNHLINKRVNTLKFDFAGSIDTIANDIKKTILLTSSKHSRAMGVPRSIRLEYVLQKPDRSKYTDSHLSLAILLEGNFESVYKNRVRPIELKEFKEKSESTKIIVISDGDIIKNQLDKGSPLELGFDKWTNTFFDNKTFLLNCVNYLLDDVGLIYVRSKKTDIPFLNKEKTYNEKEFWKIFNIITPLLFLLAIGIVYVVIRKNRYKKIK